MSGTIDTVVKMLESLPESAQSKVTEQLRNYIEELQDDIHWDTLFDKSQKSLIEAAQQAKREMAQGKAKPMDIKKL
jgi:hypothetical protein